MIKKALLLLFLLLALLPQPWLGRNFLSTQLIWAKSAYLPPIIINEIAWMGTETSHNDEWIELRNNSGSPINLENWLLRTTDGSPEIKLTGVVPANSFYLLERTDEDSVPEITADLIYTGSLSNRGENLGLYDSKENLIDDVDCLSGWPAGDNSTKQTMERTENWNWQTSKNPGGTPKAENSKPVKIKPPSESTENGSPTAQKMAAGGQNPRQSAVALSVALILAIFSGITILILKKKSKLS